MSHEQEIEKKAAPKAEQAAENLTQEAVKDTFTKGANNEGSFKRDSTNAVNESAKQALPDFEITNDKNGQPHSMKGAEGSKQLQTKLEELAKDPNGSGGGGKAGESMKGAKDNAKVQKQLEELAKDPNGKGGGGHIDLKEGLPSGGGGRAGKMAEGELQKGQSGGGGFKGGKYENGAEQTGKGGAALGGMGKDMDARIGAKETDRAMNNFKEQGKQTDDNMLNSSKKPVIEKKVVK